MVSGTSVVTERSPYYVRTSFTLGQQSGIIADWAIKNGSHKAVSVLSDWAPGAEAGKVFEANFTKGGGQVLETLKVPLANPDFAPFLQRAADLHPDTLFVFVPAGQAGTFARQFAERGLDKSGIKLIGPGDITDDDDLPTTGDTLLGVVTAGIYSAAHPSALNKEYVAAYQKATGHRANFISVGGYDGMHLIYEALKKTGGNTDADKVIAAMKGMSWESPRGPISIDPQHPRHRAERLHPQGREEGRRAVGRRVRDLRGGEGPAEGSGGEVAKRRHAAGSLTLRRTGPRLGSAAVFSAADGLGDIHDDIRRTPSGRHRRIARANRVGRHRQCSRRTGGRCRARRRATRLFLRPDQRPHLRRRSANGGSQRLPRRQGVRTRPHKRAAC